jgi:ribosomal protein L30/L7E
LPKTLKVTLVKSIIGSAETGGTVKALGLRHIRQMVEHEDKPDGARHDQRRPFCLEVEER